MKDVQIPEIVGKTIRYNRFRYEAKFTGSKFGRVQIPDGHNDYQVTGVIDEATCSRYVILSILIDDDTEGTTLLLEPHEVKMLLLGVPVRLFTGNTYTLV